MRIDLCLQRLQLCLLLRDLTKINFIDQRPYSLHHTAKATVKHPDFIPVIAPHLHIHAALLHLLHEARQPFNPAAHHAGGDKISKHCSEDTDQDRHSRHHSDRAHRFSCKSHRLIQPHRPSRCIGLLTENGIIRTAPIPLLQKFGIRQIIVLILSGKSAFFKDQLSLLICNIKPAF